MYGKTSLLLILLGSLAFAADFSGASALEFTRRTVEFGPRPPGSEAQRKLRLYIRSKLSQLHCEISEDVFTAQTPVGRVEMRNIIARFPGKSGKILAITGHYDTKSIPGVFFVGANDGGSSTGFLLEMARVLDDRPRKDDIYLVWFDGEEAYGWWSDTNGTYGSRHLARKWAADGTLRRLKALINVDMIGDRDLRIVREWNSSASLRKLVWNVAGELGFGRHFLNDISAIEDDHMPFVRLDANALNLIDFDYGPNNSWWHTKHDTMEKLSAESLHTVGSVLTAVIDRLQR